MGIGQISVSKTEHVQILAGFCAQGLIGFKLRNWLVCAHLVKDKLCFIGSGFRAKVCFFHWSFLNCLGLF